MKPFLPSDIFPHVLGPFETGDIVVDRVLSRNCLIEGVGHLIVDILRILVWESRDWAGFGGVQIEATVLACGRKRTPKTARTTADRADIVFFILTTLTEVSDIKSDYIRCLFSKTTNKPE